MPKQFVKLFDERSLFELTAMRNKKVCDSLYIVSNEQQYFIAMDQLHSVNLTKNSSFLLESIAKNTAPAIALACFDLDPQELVLVTPSDHLIKDEKAYAKSIKKAKKLAKKDYLVTFGIKPNFPETGFGYIESDGENVLSFKEKPDLKTAQKYLKKGNYYWNSGIFCFKAGVFLQELKEHDNEIYKSSLKAYENSKKDNASLLRINKDFMVDIPNQSVDYAVMEKSSKVKVVPSDIRWSDLGSFDSIYEELEKDSDGNTQNNNTIKINATNNLILGSNKLIVTIDVNDLIIVDTPDALLVSKRGSSQKVKEVVATLNNQKSSLTHTNTLVYRPWGSYEVLLEQSKYKIKRIVVNPGKKLSLQKHFHRNEHWIVVSGTATVTVGDEVKLVRPNESTYIKMGEIHRLENSGKIPIVLIEAQVGEYTGEDDIIRLDDDYHRV